MRAETLSLQHGIWIDRQRLAEAGLHDQVQITVRRGEIRIRAARPKVAADRVGSDDPLLGLAGTLSGSPLSAEDVERELYDEEGSRP